MDFVYRLATAARMPLLMTTGTRVLTFNPSSPPPLHTIYMYTSEATAYSYTVGREAELYGNLSLKAAAWSWFLTVLIITHYTYIGITPQESLYRNTCALSESSKHNQSSVSAIIYIHVFVYTCRLYTWWCKTSLRMFNAHL